ncbi:MAG TPA: hypothetical protein VN706_04445 [Gemmatimonadaceae bacterium]|nr:hypothetical protein [Gemmatimonadaceae bacterium]
MTNPLGDAVDRARTRRIIIIAVITVIVEGALFAIARIAPALAGLIRPVYLVVLACTAITGWHALRRRPGHDRRHSDRRNHAGLAAPTNDPTDHRAPD